VAWVFRRKGLPVEIIAEFEHWRRIRDSEGEEGWVYQSLLAGNRTAIVEPWKKGTAVALRSEPRGAAPPVAMLKSGVIAEVEQCTGQWCELSVGGYDGWIDQAALFGVYPGETLEN
jgi:SH3-like domain-containing protein